MTPLLILSINSQLLLDSVLLKHVEHEADNWAPDSYSI